MYLEDVAVPMAFAGFLNIMRLIPLMPFLKMSNSKHVGKI